MESYAASPMMRIGRTDILLGDTGNRDQRHLTEIGILVYPINRAARAYARSVVPW
jgi:hypothetical protein